jgi:hypothetical protein
MVWKKRFVLFFVLFLLIAVLNFISRKKMVFSYADLPGYNQLYEVNGQLKINHFTENEDQSISIAFSGNGIITKNLFKVYFNNILLAQVTAPKLTFKPLPGIKKYYIKVNDNPGYVTIDVSYTPDSIYNSAGIKSYAHYEITDSNIPVGSGPLYSVNDWAFNFDIANNEIEHNEADRYLKDSMHIKATDPSMDRVLKIANFILRTVKGMDGTPSDSMTKLSPINQLKCAQAGKSKLWCGSYTAIFSYFASRAGIPVRFIECGINRSDISTGSHVFNEVFLKEYNRWLYVDLMAKTVFVKKGDQYLNVIDVQRLIKYSIDDADFVAYYFNGDSIVQKPFNQVASTARYYFHRNNSFNFYFGDYLKRQNPGNWFERAKKIFYTKPYYALYGDNIGNRSSQLVYRIITTYLMFLFLGLCLFSGSKFLRQKASVPKSQK